MSLENIQTLSKVSLKSKNMRAQLFFKKIIRAASQKKLCTHIFLSLERFWRFSKLILPFFGLFFEK